MIRFTIYMLLLLLPMQSAAQQQDTTGKSRITITATDILEMKDMTNYTVMVSGMHDTIFFRVDSISSSYFELEPHGQYTAIISKPGYPVLSMQWIQPAGPESVWIEFFMLKEKLSKKEKRRAHIHSVRKAVDVRGPEDGGFQVLGPGKREVFVWRLRMFGPDGTVRHTSYESAKF